MKARALRRRYGHLFGFGGGARKDRGTYATLVEQHGGFTRTGEKKDGRWDAYVNVYGRTLIGEGNSEEAAVRSALLKLPREQRNLFSRGAEW